MIRPKNDESQRNKHWQSALCEKDERSTLALRSCFVLFSILVEKICAIQRFEHLCEQNLALFRSVESSKRFVARLFVCALFHFVKESDARCDLCAQFLHIFDHLHDLDRLQSAILRDLQIVLCACIVRFVEFNFSHDSHTLVALDVIDVDSEARDSRERSEARIDRRTRERLRRTRSIE
jgi:hypothetical protein